MNVAALMSGFMVDAFVIGIPEHVHIGDTSWTGIRFLILSCTMGNIASVLITYFCTRDIKMLEDEEIEATAASVGPIASISSEASDGCGAGSGVGVGKVSSSPLHTEKGQDLTISAAATAPDSNMDSSMETFQPKQEKFVTVLKELLSSPTFRRFTVFILILVNLRSIFRYYLGI